MKNSVLIAATAALVAVQSALAAADASAPASSKITAVAVYTDRAVVTRTADLNLSAGAQEIRFERLPAGLLDASLQVSGSGPANATILNVWASETFVEAPTNDRVKALENDANALLKQMRAIGDRSSTLNEQRDFVRRMLASATTTPSAAPGAAAPAARPPLTNGRSSTPIPTRRWVRSRQSSNR